MARKLVLALTAAFAVGVAHSSAVHRSLRQQSNRHRSQHPVNLIVHNASDLISQAVRQQECGKAVPTTAADMKDFNARCPSTCPLFVEDTTNGKKNFCDFACVSSSIQSCKDKNPMTPVSDPKTGVCRRCEVTGCLKCNPDGTDTCATCMEGYQLKSNGMCGYTWFFFFGYCALILLLVLVAILAVIAIGWIVDLYMRESANEEGLNYALAVRSRAKIHMPKSQLFLHESVVKSTEEPGEYEVLEDCSLLKHRNQQKPSDHKASKGDIVKGIMDESEHGRFLRMNAPRKLWPLTTNLCRQDVAGPAVTLLFNFQAAIIIWALVIIIAWKLTASYTDEALLTLGTKPMGTDRQNCVLVDWGYETQNRLMYVKVGFLLFCYLWSFLGATLFGIRQWRIYTSDTGNTHRDFCVLLTGLPQISGDVLIEDDLKAQIAEVTEQNVVGVSVGWEAKENWDDFQQAMQFGLAEVELKDGAITARSQERTPHQSPRTTGLDDTQNELEQQQSEASLSRVQEARRKAHAMALKVEGFFVHPVTQAVLTRGRQKRNLAAGAQEDEEDSFISRETPSGSTNLQGSVVSIDEDMLTNEIKKLHTASSVFVIFESEFGRDAGFEKIKEHGMEFKYKNKEAEEETCTLRAEVPDYEPQSVLWQNLSSEASWKGKLKKVGWMFGVVLLTCLFLATFEYGYAIIQINNVRSSGEEGITLSFLLFTVLVAGMMACLCAISATVAEMANFERVGHRETCFVLLYTFSVILQVSLDSVIAFAVGKYLMEANGVRTHDGTPFEDLQTRYHFTEIFESYAMQKHIGVTIQSFGFPCAFLVPFLVEPIVSIYMPYKIMSLLIKSHPELKGNAAEGYMEAVPMDLGRYGDCMINVIIASLILWFPSGFNLTMFTFLFCSHCYIYLYDHYRVLRSVASIYIATYSVDFWAQWIFSIPCGIIAGALTFKLNCEAYLPELFPGIEHFPGMKPAFGDRGEWTLNKAWGTHCDSGFNVWLKVAVAFFGHIAIHTLVLLFIVKFCGKTDETEENHFYKDTAESIPGSWFSCNLIHCLRSKYIYTHDPPQDMCIIGKEHVMRVNPAIGAHFRDDKAEREDYDGKGMNLREGLQNLSRKSFNLKPDEQAELAAKLEQHVEKEKEEK